MESEKSSFIESKEQPERFNELTIDFIRHGESKYTDSSPDLTDKGVEQIKKSADELKAIISPEEKVVIWNSPAARARDSAKIIRNALEEQGVSIVKQSEIGSLRPIKINDLEFVQNLFKEAVEQGRPDTAFMTHPEFAKEENEKMETRPQAEKRMDRVLNYLRYLAEHVDFQNQGLRMLIVSHFELAEPLAQEVFGFHEPFRLGDRLEIKMRYDRENKKTEIYFSFRGQEQGPFAWNKDQRELRKV
ncbi:MAG: histidine phosphatase family protein [Candidatus Doudnabacteria bacterium]